MLEDWRHYSDYSQCLKHHLPEKHPDHFNPGAAAPIQTPDAPHR
jgi:hypothetical protein